MIVRTPTRLCPLRPRTHLSSPRDALILVPGAESARTIARGRTQRSLAKSEGELNASRAYIRQGRALDADKRLMELAALVVLAVGPCRRVHPLCQVPGASPVHGG